MTERELIDRARAGDEEAFASLVRDNEKRVYNLALRMTGNQEDALDLAQETFLNACRGLRFFNGDSACSTWLYRLASNACIDHLRRERRQAQAVSISLDDEGEERQTDIPDERFCPETELERQDLRRAVERGLEQLSAEHRQVLVLREIHGLSYQEFGQALDLEEGTVKSRIARARLALRKILLSDGNFSGNPTSNSVKDKQRKG